MGSQPALNDDYRLKLKTALCTVISDLADKKHIQNWRAKYGKYMADTFIIIIPLSGKCDNPFESLCDEVSVLSTF